jgi:hypothetical protein
MEQEYNKRESASDNGRDEDGVDVTLIRWMLSLSPRQRLDVLQNHVNSVLRLRESIRPRP